MRRLASVRAHETATRAPRVMIGGTRSGVGKTTVTLGIIGALRRRGLRVQPFKVGPDYIDGSYHTAVSGLPCRNLDAWLLPHRTLRHLLTGALRAADVGVVEGVMGLFDGSGQGDRCSSAHIARLLRCPVLLVVDASASATSVGAEVLGFAKFDPRIDIAGVIVNQVHGRRHADWCAAAVRRTGLRALGCLPHDGAIALPERHLGLVPALEQTARDSGDPTGVRTLRAIVDLVEQHIDLDAALAIAHRAPPIATEADAPAAGIGASSRAAGRASPSIGIALDSAFNFYYRDALDALERAGARLRFFSPAAGEFPECDALYIGGGFPETHLAQLAVSPSTPRVRRFCGSGAPVLAECGGLMYLTRSITDFEGRRRKMVGFLEAETRMVPKLTLAYTIAEARTDCLLARAGARIRGHEFHRSTLEDVPEDARFAYRMERGVGIIGHRDGWMHDGVLASFMHTHLAAGRSAERLVDIARRASRR